MIITRNLPAAIRPSGINFRTPSSRRYVKIASKRQPDNIPPSGSAPAQKISVLPELNITEAERDQILSDLNQAGAATVTLNKESRELFQDILRSEAYNRTIAQNTANGGRTNRQTHYLTPPLSTAFEDFTKKLLQTDKVRVNAVIRAWDKTGLNQWHVDGNTLGMILALQGSGTEFIPNDKHKPLKSDSVGNVSPAAEEITEKRFAERGKLYVFLGKDAPKELGDAWVHRSPKQNNRVILLVRATLL